MGWLQNWHRRSQDWYRKNRTADQHAVAVALGQMALMLNSGVDPGRALDVLAAQSSDLTVGEAFQSIAQLVTLQGIPLSAAMMRFPKVFPGTVLLLVRSGEETSDLASCLVRASEMLERRYQLGCRIKESLVSPAITTLACACVLFLITKFVLPNFLALYDTMGMSLPLISRLVIATVHILNHPLFLVGMLVSIVLMFRYQDRLRQLVFDASLKWTTTRTFMGSILAVQFVDTLATTQRDGVPILRTLELLRTTTPYHTYQAQLREVSTRLQEEGSLATAVEAISCFPPMIKSMLLVGEESGHMEELLQATRRLLEEQNEICITQMVSLVEPLAIFVMGIVMGVIAVGMFLPIYGLLTHLGA